MVQNNQSVIEYFTNLGLSDWIPVGNLGEGGQARTTEVKNQITGELGVFRVLKRNNKKDIARFNRELAVLTKTNHPNIIKILDHTKDEKHQWYISKKGDRFEVKWNNFVKNNLDNPDYILEESIKILNALTDGLIELHQQGIIHRDIKAKNLNLVLKI